jgi:hypothetical protein
MCFSSFSKVFSKKDKFPPGSPKFYTRSSKGEGKEIIWWLTKKAKKGKKDKKGKIRIDDKKTPLSLLLFFSLLLSFSSVILISSLLPSLVVLSCLFLYCLIVFSLPFSSCWLSLAY